MAAGASDTNTTNGPGVYASTHTRVGSCLPGDHKVYHES